MQYYGATDKGIVRKQNQDVFLCEEIRLINSALLMVCDGMGGAKAGNIASTIACDVFEDSISQGIDPFGDETSATEVMKKAAIAANEAVYEKSVSEPDCAGMGTTLVASLMIKDKAVILNIGDSRAYHISRTGGIRQVTCDHSVVEDMIARGDITRLEAKSHPNRNLITRAVGTASDVSADMFYVEMKDSDRLLLCSDGLSNLVGDEELLYEILKSDDVKESCEALIKLALVRGAPDNVTAVIYRK